MRNAIATAAMPAVDHGKTDGAEYTVSVRRAPPTEQATNGFQELAQASVDASGLTLTSCPPAFACKPAGRCGTVSLNTAAAPIHRCKSSRIVRQITNHRPSLLVFYKCEHVLNCS